MEEPNLTPPSDDEPIPAGIRSLRDLIDAATGKTIIDQQPKEDAGLAEPCPIPSWRWSGSMR